MLKEYSYDMESSIDDLRKTDKHLLIWMLMYNLRNLVSKLNIWKIISR